MSKTGDRGFALGKVYAAAMFELAEATGQSDVLGEELHEFTALVRSDAVFSTFLASPVVDVGVRERTIEKALRGKVGDLLVNALQVLNRNDRMALLGAVADAYHALYEDKKGRVEVEVRTAVALTDVLRDRLRESLRRVTGRQVDLLETVDESILGGMVVQVGDDRYDSSVARMLRALGEQLGERASRELHSGKQYSVGTA